MKSASALACLSLALLFAGGASPTSSPDIRPVRTIVVSPRAEGESVSLTGHIRARTEESLAFRIDGRMIARKIDVGAEVKPGDLIASRTFCSAGDGSARSDAIATSVVRIDTRKIDMWFKYGEKRSALKKCIVWRGRCLRVDLRSENAYYGAPFSRLAAWKFRRS